MCVELIKARGLRSVNLRQVIAEGYLIRSPSGPLRPNPSPFVDSFDIHAYFMQKYRSTCSLQHDQSSREMLRHCLFSANAQQSECLDDLGIKDLVNQSLFQAINANNFNYARIKRLKRAYMKMEVKRVELEEALKSLNSSMMEQEAQHKAELTAWDTKHKELQEDLRAQTEKIQALEGKNEELESENQRLRA
ncbi:hypothetical protein JCGZ_14746 [Jatropha curcas]|uniref:Uncharacterized protein n=1 Tax=Jatropha curcas TaxID=180498 RepID=A0A067KKA8_JATCU|nr:hypothetical protein JCGZ_14746 [Jatropha curcas]